MKRRQNVLIILFVIAIMAVYTGYEANKPQPIDWSPNFSISKKSPYGTYIIKDALPYLFPEGEVSFARMSVREQLRVGRTPFLKTYFFVSPFLRLFREIWRPCWKRWKAEVRFSCRQNLFPIHCILTWVFQE